MKQILVTLLIINSLLVFSQEYSFEKIILKDGITEQKTYFPDGSIYTIEYYDNNKRTGEWKIFSEDDGELQEVQHYKNDKKDGVQIIYYYNQVDRYSSEAFSIKLQEVYSDGILIESREYYENDNLELVQKFNHSETSTKHYYPNGQLAEEGVLKDGKPISEWKEYNKNGQISKISYYDDKSKETGEWKIFYKGELREVKNYKNGNKDGVQNFYHRHSKYIRSQETYNNGLLIETKSYYRNGNLKLLRKFNKYGETGEWQVCQKDGKLFVLENWKNGKANGLTQVYYSSFKEEMLLSEFGYTGKKSEKNDSIITQPSKCYKNERLKTEGNKKNNYKVGLWTTYYKNGKLKSRGEYIRAIDNKGSHKNGLWTTYDKNGNIDEIGNYKNDLKIGKWESYYEGKLSSVGTYKNGKATGKWKINYSIGGYGFEKYKNGKKNGRTKQFYDTKKLKLTGKYKDNKKVGTWKWYSENGQRIEIKHFDKNGIKIGKWMTPVIDVNGKAVAFMYQEYKNGKKDGEYRHFVNKTLFQSGQFLNDKAVGKWEMYDEKGKVIEWQIYENGKLIDSSCNKE